MDDINQVLRSVHNARKRLKSWRLEQAQIQVWDSGNGYVLINSKAEREGRYNYQTVTIDELLQQIQTLLESQ